CMTPFKVIGVELIHTRAGVAQGSLFKPCGFSRSFVFLCLKSVDRREWKSRRVANRNTLRTAGLQIEPCATPVSTGLKSGHFRRFSGIQFGLRAPLRHTPPCHLNRRSLRFAELFSDAIEFDSGQATTLRRTQVEKRW